jgi:hypothetical protein
VEEEEEEEEELNNFRSQACEIFYGYGTRMSL